MEERNESPISLSIDDVVHNEATTKATLPRSNAPKVQQQQEVKKLRSRRAAQSRRLCENNEFMTLAESLPLSRDILSQLDKATIVRLTISYLSLRYFVQGLWPDFGNDERAPACERASPVPTVPLFAQPDNSGIITDHEAAVGTRILEAFEGFVFCMSKDLKFMYVSETVSVGLGLSQIDLLGTHFLDYVHEDDREMAEKVLTAAFNAVENLNDGAHIRFSSRMKSSLVKRASRDMEDKSVGFKVVEFFVKVQTATRPHSEVNEDPTMHQGGLLAAGIPLPSNFSQDYRLESDTFVLTTNLALKIHYSNQRAEELLCGTKEAGLNDTNVYRLVHPDDLPGFAAFHKEILQIGASSSDYYRMLLPEGGWTWIHSYGLKIMRSKSQNNNQMITLINQIIS